MANFSSKKIGNDISLDRDGNNNTKQLCFYNVRQQWNIKWQDQFSLSSYMAKWYDASCHKTNHRQLATLWSFHWLPMLPIYGTIDASCWPPISDYNTRLYTPCDTIRVILVEWPSSIDFQLKKIICANTFIWTKQDPFFMAVTNLQFSIETQAIKT